MSVGIWVHLETKPDKAEEVAVFLKQAADLASQEADILVWFSVQLDPTTFSIFHTFSSEVDRESHLAGGIAAQITGKSDEWFVKPPETKLFNVLADKLLR